MPENNEISFFIYCTIERIFSLMRSEIQKEFFEYRFQSHSRVFYDLILINMFSFFTVCYLWIMIINLLLCIWLNLKERNLMCQLIFMNLIDNQFQLVHAWMSFSIKTCLLMNREEFLFLFELWQKSPRDRGKIWKWDAGTFL